MLQSSIATKNPPGITRAFRWPSAPFGFGVDFDRTLKPAELTAVCEQLSHFNGAPNTALRFNVRHRPNGGRSELCCITLFNREATAAKVLSLCQQRLKAIADYFGVPQPELLIDADFPSPGKGRRPDELIRSTTPTVKADVRLPGTLRSGRRGNGVTRVKKPKK